MAVDLDRLLYWLLSGPEDWKLPPETQRILEDCHRPWPPESPAVAPTPEVPQTTRAQQRLARLVQWEERTGGKRSHLHNGRIRNPDKPGSALISKNQFFAWLRGELSSRATAT